MKILNVNITIDSQAGGGTAERTNQMSRFLVQKNHECTILTFFSKLSVEKIKELNGINLIMLPILSKRFFIPKSGFNKIKKAVKDADIIHVMNHWTILNALVYYYARHFEKPYVVCPAGALPIFGRSKLFKKLFNLIVGNRLIQNANAQIAVAVNEIEQYKVYGIEKEKITLIPNGTFLNDFQLQDDFKPVFIYPEKYILFIGRLNYIKGPDLLLEAFAKLPPEYKNYHLVFAGPDDGLQTLLQNTAKNLCIDNKVHFLGSVHGAHKNYAYKHASFLAVPSRQEAMSIVVLEGGLFSLPTLITDQCGFDLESNNAGYVVEANAKGLELGLVKMLTNSKSYELGNNLKNLVHKEYTWESVGKKLLHLYQQVISFK